MGVTYEIKTTEIKPFSYRTPLIDVDADGKLSVQYSRQHAVQIKRLVLLNLVGRDEAGNIVSYVPIEHVNRFLIAHHVNDNKQESEQYSKGLLHYFSFLLELQRIWDEEYDEALFDELVDLPRPTWDSFPLRKHEKVTYQYREALQKSVLEPCAPSLSLSRTTAKAYMSAVVKFYSFHIRDGYQFNNPPFEHEVVSIQFQANGTSMRAYMSKDIHTTDLRLNLGGSKRNEGGALPSSRRDLKPLTDNEWQAVEDIIINTHRVLKSVNGKLTTASLQIEYCLFFLVARYTGLRKEEIASLHAGQIVKPNLNQKVMRIGVGDEYGSLTKTKGGGNKSRRTIIPTRIMQLLFEYTLTNRFKKRLKKFKELCTKKREAGELGYFGGEDGVDQNKNYLFISQTGKPLFTKLSEANARWNEVRSTVKVMKGIEVEGVIHNLRPTFAVSLFRQLLRSTDVDTALALVSDCLGHDDESTTIMYLKIAQNAPTGDEIYEDVLDYLGAFENLDNLEFKGL